MHFTSSLVSLAAVLTVAHAQVGSVSPMDTATLSEASVTTTDTSAFTTHMPVPASLISSTGSDGTVIATSAISTVTNGNDTSVVLSGTHFGSANTAGYSSTASASASASAASAASTSSHNAQVRIGEQGGKGLVVGLAGLFAGLGSLIV